MNSLSIIQKIWSIIALALLAFAAVVTVSVNFTSKNNSTIESMRDYMYESSKLATQVRVGFESLDEFFTQAVTLSDPDILSTAQQHLASLQRNLQRLLQLNPEQQSLLQQLARGVEQYANTSSEIAGEFIEGTADFAVISDKISSKTQQFESLKQQFTVFEQQSDQRFTTAVQDVYENMQFSLQFILLLGGVLMLILAGLGHYIARQISLSARQLGESMAELASGKGNLSSRLEVVSKDELGTVATEFNAFISTLQASFAEVTRIIEPLTNSSRQLAEGMSQLESLTKDQTNDSSTVTRSMTELQQSVQEISSSAGYAADSANKANELAKNGFSKTRDAVNYSQGLADEIKQAQHVITELEEKTRNVTAILQSINDIADQTNLLALNAAIEAARAGEHGRGFSVVADEVRNLSTKTAESVTTVQRVLGQLNANVSNAVQIMKTAVGNAEHSASLATDAGSAIASISEEIEQINQLNSQIAAATGEQRQVADRIAANTEKMALSFEHTKGVQESVHDISDGLRGLSVDLSKVSAKFKT
ncbi:methyl-accepting chemotaxis protein [Arsukibacterium sp.]|uniref:methyl-accepting chemotaxis protein n=1 Tax=Arsukibacterium sp. TaxID=1977258 RepID=UPI002FDAF854